MLVREVMTTPVVTVPPAASIRQAVRLLYEQNITAAPVVDDEGRLAGIVSEMDLLRREFEADPRAFARPAATPDEPPPHRVAEVMTRETRTVRETTDVAELADLMITTGLKSVPVLRGDTLVGIVSRRDLMGVLAHSDARIRDDVLAAIEELLPGATTWSVSVQDGTVRLRGRADPRTQEIVDVLARTVPGVSRVDIVGTTTD
ncbi:CBS domain-containing protein [Actinomadura scrupuli]|uniref:CBS domain-containing protein n=1 Tax=Actinomadura scrupuli TaxID=559629 RepID=UPI003D981C47